MRPEGNKHVTKSFDLLYKGVEIGTGARREHRRKFGSTSERKGIELKKCNFTEIFSDSECRSRRSWFRIRQNRTAAVEPREYQRLFYCHVIQND